MIPWHKCTLSKFADDTQLGGTAVRIEGRNAIQRDQDTVEKQAHENLMRLNMAKCKVLHLAGGSPKCEYKAERLGQMFGRIFYLDSQAG